MIDAAQTVDTVKLRFYIDWLYNNHIYDEGESGYHKDLTAKFAEKYFDPMNLPLDAHILDLGCGPGYFLDEIKRRGYTNYTGVTLSPGDVALCESKGHRIKRYDLSFLPQREGYDDESVDFIFLRHALEHSPFPIISLMEYNRVLKQFGKIYIEVPAPDCDRKHEFNLNHYSILGQQQLAALLIRCGFDINAFDTVEFTLQIPEAAEEGKDPEVRPVKERFYCIVATKQRPLDIK
jgi:SAM-dependent methyltransferase